MNSPKVAQKNPHLNASDNKIKNMRSQQAAILLRKQYDVKQTEFLTDMLKNNLNEIDLTKFDSRNTTENKSLNQLFNRSDTEIDTDPDFKANIKKFIYDHRKKDDELEELKKSYNRVCQDYRILKEQNGKIVNFLKELLTKLQDSQLSENSTGENNSNQKKHSLSIAKFQKSSHYHKQKNAILQYTMEQLIKKVGDEWTKLRKKAKEVSSMEEVFENTNHQNKQIQQLQQIIQKQKIQIQKISQQKSMVSQLLTKQKQKLEALKQSNEIIRNSKLSALQSQNKLLRQQVSDLWIDLQNKQQKLSTIIKIATQSNVSTTKKIKH